MFKVLISVWLGYIQIHGWIPHELFEIIWLGRIETTPLKGGDYKSYPLSEESFYVVYNTTFYYFFTWCIYYQLIINTIRSKR